MAAACRKRVEKGKKEKREEEKREERRKKKEETERETERRTLESLNCEIKSAPTCLRSRITGTVSCLRTAREERLVSMPDSSLSLLNALSFFLFLPFLPKKKKGFEKKV